MNNKTIHKKRKQLQGTVQLPASKSISNRLLILDFLSEQTFDIEHLSTSDDTQLLRRLLSIVAENKGSEDYVDLDCGQAGSVFRFLTAALAITPGKWRLTGSERLQERPIAALVAALNQLGANISYESKADFAPLLIQYAELSGGDVQINADQSSQFISALMLIAPFLENGLNIELMGDVVSLPYIQMTAGVLELCGVKTVIGEDAVIKVSGRIEKPLQIRVSADWTSASYFYALAALADKAELLFPDLSFPSLQGDSILLDVFDSFGVKTSLTEEGVRIQKCMHYDDDQYYMDFADYPDLAPTMAVLCAAMNLEAELSGLSTLSKKESDRIQALIAEFAKMNIAAEYDEEESSLIIHRGNLSVAEPISTYQDHRMAMAFSVLALLQEIKIEDPEVVSKSYPDYWANFELITMDEE